MGLLYKAYNHLCMEGLEWGREKGKELNKDKRIEYLNGRDEIRKNMYKDDNKDFYSKFDRSR